eukprot:350480-Prorocentrum_lima.AAC.1
MATPNECKAVRTDLSTRSTGNRLKFLQEMVCTSNILMSCWPTWRTTLPLRVPLTGWQHWE